MPPEVNQIPLLDEGSHKRNDFLFVHGAKGLLALAQFGTVEFHPWGCRIDKPERPDRVVFDLDPDETLRWSDVVGAAFDVRDRIIELGLTPFVKTTGGKGLHVVVPIVRRQSWQDIHGFSQEVVQAMCRQAPHRYTASMAKRSRRGGRIFIDYHRNARGSTAVAAYSLRAAPGAPASVPVHWEELSDIDDPKDLNYATLPSRLAERQSDPWSELDRSAKAITREMRRRLAS